MHARPLRSEPRPAPPRPLTAPAVMTVLTGTVGAWHLATSCEAQVSSSTYPALKMYCCAADTAPGSDTMTMCSAAPPPPLPRPPLVEAVPADSHLSGKVSSGGRPTCILITSSLPANWATKPECGGMCVCVCAWPLMGVHAPCGSHSYTLVSTRITRHSVVQTPEWPYIHCRADRTHLPVRVDGVSAAPSKLQRES